MKAQQLIQEKLKEATASGRARIHKFEGEAQKLLKKLRDKGQDAEAVGRKRLDGWAEAPLVHKVKEAELFQRVQKLGSEVGGRIEGGVGRVREVLGVASRVDLEKITSRIDALQAQVMKLAKSPKKSAAKESAPSAPKATKSSAAKGTKASSSRTATRAKSTRKKS